ncbi:MAG: pilus assembly protein [Firmicutes bacterium HGW-Firmicutes-1]|jgi:pilus assembly protein CpaF|nr:MAG: pilus assembly protein [Firmicutes bacterium HGW-Firmicutes-1]
MDERIIEEIKLQVRNQLDLSRELRDEEIIDIIDEAILSKARDVYIDTKEKVVLALQLFNALRRLDVLQPFIIDESVTEIMVNGKDFIFIEKKGQLIQSEVRFETVERLEDVIQSIVSKMNRVVNEATPICDARLEDGSRINVVLPPIALNGPILTIRKFSKKTINMQQLLGWKAISEEAAEFLEKAIKAKYNIFISGGTGSGKTTLLNILSNFIPNDERIITIEDSAELQISQVDNVVSLETRNPNLEGKGAITISDLIRTSLRMRPDRIIVGEVRGVEALDMLQAMNTGHDGSLSTGHANSTKDMLSRLETMILSKENFPLEAIRKQIVSSIDLMVHLGRMRDKSRKILEITELVGIKDGEIQLNPLFVYEEDTSSIGNKVCGSLNATKNQMVHTEKLVLRRS